MYRLKSGSLVATAAELAVYLFGLTGARAVTITARTQPALKGGQKCPVAGVEKVSVVNGFIGFSYENSVNKQRQRDERPIDPETGDIEHFTAGPRKWGTRLWDSMKMKKVPLVAKTCDGHLQRRQDILIMSPDNLYLELKVQKSLGKKYELNGAEVPEERVTPHLRESSNPERMILRDYRLDHIEQISVDGQTFLLADYAYLHLPKEDTEEKPDVPDGASAATG